MFGYTNQPLHLALRRTVEPTSEPVTVDEAKAWCRQELDFTAEDGVFASLITTARILVETEQHRTLLPSTWLLQLDQFPLGGSTWLTAGPALVLPMPRLRSVLSIVYVDQGGNEITLSPSRYTVDAVSEPARIVPVYAQPWPVTRVQAGSVRITYTAGYDDAAAVPETTKLAIKLLVAHWYRNREAIGTVGDEIKLAFSNLAACGDAGTYR